MATIFQHDCPHCGTKDVAFAMIAEMQVPDHFLWHVLGRCGHCGAGIVAEFFDAHQIGYDPIKHYSPTTDKVVLSNTWPNPMWGKEPNHLPDNVSRFFKQGLDGLGGNYDSAGAMFRKALDVGLKEKFPELKGVLFNRIEKAVKAGNLTTDFGDWAHHIRLEGNDAVHDNDPYTEEEARDLHVFTDLVMRYLFTLPGMLKDRRGESADSVDSE